MLKKIKLFVYSILLWFGKMIYFNRSSKVLYYHDVHHDDCIPETNMSTSMSLFLKHIEIIKREGFEIVGKITKPNNQIMIAFDDGFRGIYLNRSHFIKEKVFPTVFVITEMIGKNNYLQEQEIKELLKFGFEFHSHSHTHPNLNELSKNELRLEFKNSKKILQSIYSIDSEAICFPKGYFNNKTILMAGKCGYKIFYSSIPGSFFEENQFAVKYRNLVQFSSSFNFRCILFGGLRIFRSRYKSQQYFKK